MLLPTPYGTTAEPGAFPVAWPGAGYLHYHHSNVPCLVSTWIKQNQPSFLSPCHPPPVSHSLQSSSPCSCGKICPQNCLFFAGGFSETYAALCDYNGFAFREEIQWDVDNIYHSQDCREFNLLDFSHLESRDVALSVAALSFNLWFTKLSCKDFRLVSEISEQLLYMLSKSVTLEELVLENSGLKADFVQRMAQALSSHPNSALHTINLAGNQLEDRGRQILGRFHGSPSAGAGMSTLCKALTDNKAIGFSLRHLDLSGNPGTLAGDDISVSASAVRGGVTSLTLSLCGLGGFGLLWSVPCPAAPRGWGAHGCIALWLADNSHISDLHLDLSSCELRSAGAQVIQDLIPDASSISHLDLSDNGFDPDMVTLVLSIGRSKSIRHVSLGKNFNIKSKEGLLDVLHRIVQLTQEEDCPLQSLSVAESRLKLGTNVLLSALGSNTSLVSLDISGNAMGDTGAKMLAKALQINTKLRIVVWDRNNTTAHGLLEVAQALERNYTLKAMPLPMSDVAQAYRSNPERTEEAVHKVGVLLWRTDQGHCPTRLHLSVLQMVNEICLSVQKHVDILSTCTGREVETDILCAEEAIRNANLSVSILPLLYEAGNTPYQNGKLQHKLECLTEEASQICSREIQAIMQAVLDTAQGLCPAVVQKSGVRDQLVNAMSERICLQDHLSLTAVLDQMVTDVFSKLKWVMCCSSFLLTASGLRAHRAPPSLSPAAPPARPASTKDAEPASGSLPATQPATATGFLMDLPTAGEKLEHCTKARPRPNRRHKQPPSKPNVRGGTAGRGGGVYSVLELTFSNASSLPSPTTLETCPGSAPLAPSGSRTLKKKIGNFFAFKKPKSSRGSRCEKEPEGGPTAPRSRRSMLSDILRAPSRAGESGKPLSKSEEGGLSAEPHAEPEHCQTPDSARRIRPKYSREGKSQSLILLSGEDEDALGVRHDKKRHLEKSEGELSSSFEQRVQVMLHRIGVTKGPAAESKKLQVGTGSVFGMGDIVDSSADSPPSLKARTHSVSTGGSAVHARGGHTSPWGRGLDPLSYSILPAPQTHPSAARPPGRSPAPSPGQPGEPWEGSCPLSQRPAAPSSPSPGAPSPWQSPARCPSPGAGRAGAAACHGWAGTRRGRCHGGSATVGRWVLAPCPPCPRHPIRKVGMHVGCLVPLLACSWSPWEWRAAGSQAHSGCWVLKGPAQWGAVGCPAVASPHCLHRQPADGTAGSATGDRPPSTVRPRGAAQGARVPGRAGK
uniref:Capping protein regulator and myosin 1 linker 2 n=1 Tax=Ficedula albicollis TaxID=59894 RepID=U3JXI0_FICAL